MNFKLSTIFAIAQLILVAVAMQPNSTNFTNPTDVTKISPGCFQSGEPWKNLGTNESILAAYDDQWCKFAVGGWHLGVKGNLCIRDDPIKHAFMWKWVINKIPDGKDMGYVSHSVCICFLAQVLDLCAMGGSLDLVCGPGADGGDIIGAHVLADPQDSFSCHG